MADAPDPRFAHDEATIELGRRQIAALREQLRHRGGPEPERRPDPPPRAEAPAARAGQPRPIVDVDVFGDRMAAEMAAGAERDRLAARVAQLETEVAQLRGAFADILRTAAGALSTDPSDTDAGSAATGTDPADAGSIGTGRDVTG